MKANKVRLAGIIVPCLVVLLPCTVAQEDPGEDEVPLTAGYDKTDGGGHLAPRGS